MLAAGRTPGDPRGAREAAAEKEKLRQERLAREAAERAEREAAGKRAHRAEEEAKAEAKVREAEEMERIARLLADEAAQEGQARRTLRGAQGAQAAGCSTRKCPAICSANADGRAHRNRLYLPLAVAFGAAFFAGAASSQVQPSSLRPTSFAGAASSLRATAANGFARSPRLLRLLLWLTHLLRLFI